MWCYTVRAHTYTAFPFTDTFMSTKTIICEIGCSFIGTSDELKSNHKVIHSIPFYFCRFLHIFFHSVQKCMHRRKWKHLWLKLWIGILLFWYACHSGTKQWWIGVRMWMDVVREHSCVRQTDNRYIQNGHWWLKCNWSMCTIVHLWYILFV